VLLVSVWGERKDGVTAGEHAPQRAALTGGAPASLVHVQALTGTHTLPELPVGVREGLAGALTTAGASHPWAAMLDHPG
jgi:hypothetical protein